MSFLFSKKSEQVTQDEALAGRDQRMPVPARHEVLGTPLEPPFPEGLGECLQRKRHWIHIEITIR